MEQLVINNTVIPYEIIKSEKAKKMRITIVDDQVKVTLPRGVSVNQGRQFIYAKKEWIFNKIHEFRVMQAYKCQRKYQDGEKFLYRGIEYVLEVKKFSKNRPEVELKNNVMHVFLPNQINQKGNGGLIKETLVNWYKNEAQKIFRKKLDHYSQIMNLKYNQFRVKEQKTRWGSCSNKGNINLNWKIILAPDPVLDYLIIHELAHLKYMNHSKEFWQLVARFSPQYKQWRRWLKDNSRWLFV